MRLVAFPRGSVTVGLITLGHFFSHFYLLVLPPLFPILRSEFTLSNAQLGLLISVISLGMALQLPVGELVDRVGAKVVYVIGLLLTSIAIGLMAFAPGYWALLTLAALSGVGQSTFHPAGYPLIESVSSPDLKGRFFSIHTFGGYAGFAVAPLVVGGLAALVGWQSALFAVGIAGVVGAVLIAGVLNASYKGQLEETTGSTGTSLASVRAVFGRPAILVMFLFFTVVTVANKGLQSFTPLLAVDGFALGEATGNAALSGFFALTAVGVLVGGVLADRHDPRTVILGALSACALGIWLVSVAIVPMNWWLLIGLFSIIGGFYGLIFASRDRLVSSHAAAGSTGRSFGFVFTGNAIAGVVAPAAIGFAIDISTILVGFWLIGGFFLLAAVTVLLVGRTPGIRGRLPLLSPK